MRESVFFEVRLRRFDVWQMAVGGIAALAISALTAWAVALLPSQPESGRALVIGLAALLSLAIALMAWSLARVDRGVLSYRDGIWTFVPDSGAVRSGTLEVAIDLGAFLLLRLSRPRAVSWLPVQRRGLERQWHDVRCAVYSPPPVLRDSPTALAPTSE